VTLVTLQDGKIVMRDGKIGTEQACCCGEQDPCIEGCVCFEFVCSEEDPPGWNPVSPQQFVADQGLIAILENNGYVQVKQRYISEGGVLNYALVFNCCGDVDYEAEPVWEGPDFGGGSPLCRQDGIPFLYLYPIYPCNPLP
jgi:hypothetical protein